MRSRRKGLLRGRSDPEVLRERCAIASRFVELHAAERDRAGERVVAYPESREARARLEDAEQLHCLAVWELRSAQRALRRRGAFTAFIARWTPAPFAVRPRRR